MVESEATGSNGRPRRHTIKDKALPEPFISCAQNGEDVRAWRALRNVEFPVYVEVGAQHPYLLSPTVALYRLGWQGLLVEPDPVYADLLRDFRPRDVVIEAAASDLPGTVLLNRFENTGLSTVSSEFAQLANERGFIAAELKEVKALPLKTILSENKFEQVHFLSIDVEGWELHVLRGADLTRFRPWIICIEAITPGTNQYCGLEAKTFIEAAGYRSALFDGVNDWFVAEERSSLLPDVRVGLSAADRGVYGWRPYEIDRLERAIADVESQNAHMSHSLVEARETAMTLSGDVDRLGRARDFVARTRVLPTQEPNSHSTRTSPISLMATRPVHASVSSVSLPRSAEAQRFLRRLASTVLPRSAVDSIRSRLQLRRFVSLYTSPSFISGPSTGLASGSNHETHFGFPSAFLEFATLTQSQISAARAFLLEHGNRSDASLEARLDGAGDRLGAVLSDVRASISFATASRGKPPSGGADILFDARALQIPGFRDRGIGAFAQSLLDAIRETCRDSRLVLLVDAFEEPLDESIRANSELTHSLAAAELSRFGLFFQPSPMTHDVAPLLPILESGSRCIAVIYDFIPGSYPDVYLATEASRLRYATQVRSLSMYDEYLPISSTVEKELHRWVPGSIGQSRPSWPEPLANSEPDSYHDGQREPLVVVFGANEPRKNTLAAFAGLARIRETHDSPLNIVALGLGSHTEVAQHWVELAGFSPGDVTISPHISDVEKVALLKRASLVLVPSFAEGLSLPVLEAVSAGAPVVASNIDAHHELLGPGRHLANPAQADQWASAIRWALKRPGKLSADQRNHFRSVRKTSHVDAVSQLIATQLRQENPSSRDQLSPPKVQQTQSGRRATIPRTHKHARLSVGIATPWPRQRSGVADYSWATLNALSRIADVTVYVSPDATRSGSVEFRDVEEAYASHRTHDAFISVLGNSSFHLPAMELAERIGGLTLCHDSRMIEYYLALSGETRSVHLMTGDQRATGHGPTLLEQVEQGDYVNLGYKHIADFSSAMLFHSRKAATRVHQEAGGVVDYVPFVPLRQPGSRRVVSELRGRARMKLGFREGEFHIVSLGIVDNRMKLHDHILEAVMWARSWGLKAHLHFVGSQSANSSAIEAMKELSTQAGPEWFRTTGYVNDSVMRNYLSGADLVIQLRSGSVAMMSAPVADAAAFGTPTLASSILLEDDALPDFVSAAPDYMSPVLLAEAIMERSRTAIDLDGLERARREYLASRNPKDYARILLERVEAHR